MIDSQEAYRNFESRKSRLGMELQAKRYIVVYMQN